jgi:hypothetical protein
MVRTAMSITSSTTAGQVEDKVRRLAPTGPSGFAAGVCLDVAAATRAVGYWLLEGGLYAMAWHRIESR